MPEFLIIIIILIMIVVLLLSGLYIHSVLLASGIIGLIMLEGFGILTGLVGNEPFRRVASYSLTTIPLFVLMAQFILHSGIVQDMFYMIHRLSRGRNGLLGALTIIVGGLLGAVSGSGTATAASLGQVAVPELTKHGYKPELAAAIASSGGALSGIVPPSIILILYGVATETPIGGLFIGAVIPSILLVLVFILVMLFSYYNSMKSRKVENGSFAENENTSKDPVKLTISRMVIVNIIGILIVAVIFGGIYSGIFTPTEAGAVGAFVAFIFAVILGKVNFKFLYKTLTETIKVTGMVMLILIGAQIFGRFVSLSLLPRKLIALLEPIMDYPALVLVIITIVLFVLFMFIEGAAVILMSIPVILPIIQAIQVDVLWFGVFISMICTIGLITPPVGLSVYAVSGVSKISPESIFKYTMLFAVVSTVIVGGLMIIFPEIVLWLPSSMN